MPGQATVTIKDKQWSVAIANTYLELVSGLSGVKSLSPQTGMLFDLGYDQQYIAINMSEMLFPLDIIFINSTQGVVGVLENVPPGQDAYLNNQTLPGARCFLEINAGEASGIALGDSVAIHGYVQGTQVDIVGVLSLVATTVPLISGIAKAASQALGAGKERPGRLPQTELVQSVRKLWVKACQWEGVPTESRLVVFSEENPYIREYNEAVSKLLRFKRFHTGEYRLATIGKGRRLPCPAKPEYLADSREFLTQTIEDIGYREKLDTAFQNAIRRARGA